MLLWFDLVKTNQEPQRFSFPLLLKLNEAVDVFTCTGYRDELSLPNDVLNSGRT